MAGDEAGLAMSEGEEDASSGREARDSVFLHATVTASQGEGSGVFRIRNISSGGLMAEGPFTFSAGDELDVDLRNIGVVHGRVAWSSTGRFGMMFDRAIDPRMARKPVGGGGAAPAPLSPGKLIVPPFSGRGRPFAM
jgi:hypothetical protein